MKLRLSPTTIGQWQVCKRGQYNNTLADFENYLRQSFEAKFAISVGSAWHKLLETGGQLETFFADDNTVYEAVSFKENGYEIRFTGEPLELASAIRAAYTGVKELRFNNTYELPILQHSVYSEMVIDCAQGVILHEFKTKLATEEPGEYMLEMAADGYKEAIQWRMYLDGLQEAQKVVYTIAYLHVEEKEPPAGSMVIINRCYQPLQLEFERYPTLNWDILQWMEGLVRHCENGNFLDLIKFKER